MHVTQKPNEKFIFLWGEKFLRFRTALKMERAWVAWFTFQANSSLVNNRLLSVSLSYQKEALKDECLRHWMWITLHLGKINIQLITAIRIVAGFMIVGFCRCTEGQIFLLIPWVRHCCRKKIIPIIFFILFLDTRS